MNKDDNRLPGADPEHYRSYHAPGKSPAGSALRRNQEGTEGFEPAVTGQAKAGHGRTSSFDLDPDGQKPLEHYSGSMTMGQEEDARRRLPSTSAVARATQKRSAD